MAVTADQVEVVLRAQTAQYQTDLRAADKTFTQVAANATRSSAQVNAATRNLSFNTGNLAAQFQDIGVTAAMGMNPLIIALQQGTQLSAVMNQSMQAGVNPAKALGAAFLQIINPISLGTIALVALTAAAAQYFGSLISDGKMSNEELKEQDSLIRDVADKWGDAVPALRAYVNELDRAKDVGDIGATREFLVGRAFDELRAKIPDLRVELAAARIDVHAFGGTAEEIDALQSAFDTLVGKVEDNTATAADLDAVLALLAGTAGAQTIPSMVNLASVLSGLSSALAAAAREAANTRAQFDALNNSRAGMDLRERFGTAEFIAEQERINGLTADQLALERETARVKSEAARNDTSISDQEALSLAEKRLAAEERRRELAAGDKAGAKAESETEREAKAVLELIEALEYEQSLLGMTAEQKAVANALREAGAAATDKQRERIEELIMATMAEADAIKASEQAMAQFQKMAEGAVTGFIGDLRAGKSAAEALSNVFDDIANQLIQIAVKNLIGAAFGGFGGGGGGGIFGSIFGGFKANGGPVSSGRTYMVGERGPELFTPSSAGNITSNRDLASSAPSEVVVYVQSTEYFDAHVETISGNVSARVTGSAIKTYDNNLTSRMGENDARYR